MRILRVRRPASHEGCFRSSTFPLALCLEIILDGRLLPSGTQPRQAMKTCRTLDTLPEMTDIWRWPYEQILVHKHMAIDIAQLLRLCRLVLMSLPGSYLGCHSAAQTFVYRDRFPGLSVQCLEMLRCLQSQTWKFFDASILERLRNVWGPIPECLGAGYTPFPTNQTALFSSHSANNR
jgi:hypothetical protein